MVGKQGYLKTIEAIVALVIILMVVFVAIPRKSVDNADVPYLIKKSQDVIKEDIILNNDLKKCIVSDDCVETALNDIGNTIEKHKPYKVIYAYKICKNPTCLCRNDDLGSECKKPGIIGPDEVKSNVYMADMFVSAVSDGVNDRHRVVRFWMWQLNE